MFYLTAKFQKNRMNGLEDISEQTDGRDSLGFKQLRRETKKDERARRYFRTYAWTQFLRSQTILLRDQKIRKMNGLQKKCYKTSIFGHFGPKWPILDSFWPKGAKQDFSSKSAWNIFSAFTSPN